MNMIDSLFHFFDMVVNLNPQNYKNNLLLSLLMNTYKYNTGMADM